MRKTILVIGLIAGLIQVLVPPRRLIGDVILQHRIGYVVKYLPLGTTPPQVAWDGATGVMVQGAEIATDRLALGLLATAILTALGCALAPASRPGD